MSLSLFESWIFQRECFGSRERLLRVVYFQTTFFLPRPPCPRLSISGKSSRPGEGRRFVLEYSAHALYAGHLLVSCCTSTSYPLGKIPQNTSTDCKHVERHNFTIWLNGTASFMFPLTPGFESQRASDTCFRGYCSCSVVSGSTVHYTHARTALAPPFTSSPPRDPTVCAAHSRRCARRTPKLAASPKHNAPSTLGRNTRMRAAPCWPPRA